MALPLSHVSRPGGCVLGFHCAFPSSLMVSSDSSRLGRLVMLLTHELPVYLFSSLLLGFASLVLIDLKAFFTYARCNVFIRHVHWKLYLPLWVPIRSLNDPFEWTKVLNFKLFQLLQLFLHGQCALYYFMKSLPVPGSDWSPLMWFSKYTTTWNCFMSVCGCVSGPSILFRWT